jgi:hypothetical protein
MLCRHVIDYMSEKDTNQGQKSCQSDRAELFQQNENGIND